MSSLGASNGVLGVVIATGLQNGPCKARAPFNVRAGVSRGRFQLDCQTEIRDRQGRTSRGGRLFVDAVFFY